MKNHNLSLPSPFLAGVNTNGSYHPLGLLGCPANFQCLMEGVLCNIANVIVFINDLLVHTKTHEEHLKVLDQVLDQLQTHNLKINLDKCFFGNKESPTWVSL
jgi:hypothetical protein